MRGHDLIPHASITSDERVAKADHPTYCIHCCNVTSHRALHALAGPIDRAGFRLFPYIDARSPMYGTCPSERGPMPDEHAG